MEEGMQKQVAEVKTFLIKHKTVLLLLIPLMLCIFLRLQPASLPVMDDWGANSLERFNKDILEQQVNSQFPHLPQQNKDKLVDQEWQKLIDQDNVFLPGNNGLVRAPYAEAQMQYANTFKSYFQNEHGQTYLLAIDPYYYARLARNVVEKGQRGDIIQEGEQWDNRRVAPLGTKADANYHIYVNVLTYRISQLFGNNDILKAIFYVPILISALAIIPCFFIIKRRAGLVGAVFGSSLLAVHSAFLTRTVGGFSDTDPYNVFFPLLIGWLFLEAFEATSKKRQYVLSILSGISVGLYSRFWSGWWYILDFIVATLVLYFLYLAYQRYIQKKGISVREPLQTGGVFLLSSMISVAVLFTGGIIKGVQQFFHSFFSFPLSIVQLKVVGVKNIWPNVLTTVAELNPSSLGQTVSVMGGGLLFALAVLGIVFTLMKDDRGKRDLKYAFFLTMWFIGTIFASTRGLRFTLLLVPAFSIALGCFLGITNQHYGKKLGKLVDISPSVITVGIVIIGIILLVSPVKAGHGQAMHEIPSMNDAWWNALSNIRLGSQDNAIITSWWDFGHWFKYVADRAVTFDGASQNLPQAHWVGRILLTDNEQEAVSIQRMLNCGGNTAYKLVQPIIEDELDSVTLIKDVIMLDEAGAQALLQEKGIPEDVITEVLANTHCTPPESFFIASEDMIGKAGVWGHFGSWHFERSAMVQHVRKVDFAEGTRILEEDFNKTTEEARKLYTDIQTNDPNQWISPWPGYLSSVNRCREEAGIHRCNTALRGQRFTVVFNESNNDAYVETGQGRANVASVTVIGEGTRRYADVQLGVGVTLIPGDRYRIFLSDPLHSNSMFTSMFYARGSNLNCFELFDEQTQPTGGKIYVYQVNFSCT